MVKLIIATGPSYDYCSDYIDAKKDDQTSYVYLQIDEDCNDYTVDKSPTTLTETSGVYASNAASWYVADVTYTTYEHSTNSADYKLT